MITFVHTADVHLDTPFSANFSPKQMLIRRKEIMQTFKKITTAAKDKDFLFISGDLFEGKLISGETVDFVKRCFSEIPDTKILIAAGNHDPISTFPTYLNTQWGENVHIFPTEMEYLDFPEHNTRIHGRSFKTAAEEIPFLNDIKIAKDWCNIVVMHGEVVSNTGDCIFNPTTKELLAKSGADYVALGHIHQASGCQHAENTWYAYPGIPEGRGFDEEGEKGFYIGEAEKGRVHLEWIPSGDREFKHIRIDVSKIQDSIQLQERIAGEINGKENAYKVVLNGKARRGMINTEILKEQLSDLAFYIDVVDETKPDYNMGEISGENTLRGAYVAALLERIDTMSDSEKEIGYMAIELGLSAMERGLLE